MLTSPHRKCSTDPSRALVGPGLALATLLLLLLSAACGDDSGGGDDGATDTSPENTSAACQDRLDNDGDGVTDCEDPDCRDFVFCAGADGDADADDGGAEDVEETEETPADDAAADADDEIEGDVDGEADGAADADIDTDDAGDGVDTGDADGDAPGDDGGTCTPDRACGAVEVCGDGLDNDCDGEVDESDAACSCEYGAVQSCFVGPPGFRGLGGCVDGWQVCGRDGIWGPCAEGIWPSDEIPDGKDNDCDGCVDDGLATSPTIQCPASMDAVLGKWQVLRCEDLCLPAGSPDCDCSWSIISPEASGVTEVPDRFAETTHVHLDASGNYIVIATILDARLDSWMCSFVLRVAPPGLHVDLWWDDPDPFQPGDIDLHLHRNPPPTAWFGDDDCHYATCGGRDGTYTLDWGYADTPLADCPDLWPDSRWDFIPLGGCPNPRLTKESIAGVEPELATLDFPDAGDRFRVMAHYYEDAAFPGDIPADAHARIVCGGVPAAQFGAVRMHSNGFGSGDLWRVADVDFLDAIGTCDVTPLGTPAVPDIQNDDSRDWF
ncbi:MAG: hypothetical protein HY905_24875 [Deltaproteobacteria bacterium]|nr:hypothetical protein [Deltaproteobacteria bacterium]